MKKSNTKLAKLESTKGSLTKLASAVKRAQDGGAMSPDEVKEMSESTLAVLNEAVEMVAEVAESVPAEQSSTDDDSIPDEGDSGSETDPETALEGSRGRIAADGDDDDDRKKKDAEKDAKIAKLEAKMAAMERDSAKTEIATKYAALWQPKEQDAKFASIMESEESLEILQAKLDTTEELLGSASSVKHASMPSKRFALYSGQSSVRVASEGKGNQGHVSMISVI